MHFVHEKFNVFNIISKHHCRKFRNFVPRKYRIFPQFILFPSIPWEKVCVPNLSSTIFSVKIVETPLPRWQFPQNFGKKKCPMATTLNDIAARLGISKSTVSKALHNATDISEATKRQILQTAAEMGYINKLQRNNTRVCIIIENMDYLTPHQFGYDIVRGFCQMAEGEGGQVDILPLNQELQHKTAYDVFMLEGG